MIINFKLFESAPRIPKSEEYWKKKGKSGKNICLIFHDDMDGIVSAIIMKNYLINQGFKIKQYGIINYQEGWQAFSINPELITIALDFANDIPGVDVYVDHHGKFSEELKLTQKRASVKTETGSAAEGIAQQIGVPFSKETKDWIDMIDSAKYSEYDVDIRSILDFDLSTIAKSENAKLNFAAAMNQLIKRSDDRTFIEVVNACNQPSIYNIYRLFKLFYPKNNPDTKGEEPEFVSSGRERLRQMELRTKGRGFEEQGFDKKGNKIRYTDQLDFWRDFAKKLPYTDVDPDGYAIETGKVKFQLKPGVYQIIGNLMYVPSGTWSNALRAKALFHQDLDNGIVPDDPKLNFVLLQYGNTLQIADLRTKIKSMKEEDLPKDKNGNPIDDLSKYCESLLKNFQVYLGYKDDRTVSGGHYGIGTISNIFGKCKRSPYQGVKYLDMFKNKIINDISGVKWSITMPWNEEEERRRTVKPEDINKKLMDIDRLRSEEEAKTEKNEKEILNYLISNDIEEREYIKKFKNPVMRKIYDIWLETHFNEIENGSINSRNLGSLRFNADGKNRLEESELFQRVVEKFGFDDLYVQQEAGKPKVDPTLNQRRQRNELKRTFRLMFDIYEDKYLSKDSEQKFMKWLKN